MIKRTRFRYRLSPGLGTRDSAATFTIIPFRMIPLGLIAGEGAFPLLVARGAKAAGRKVVCVGLAGNASAELKNECDEFHWAGISRSIAG